MNRPDLAHPGYLRRTLAASISFAVMLTSLAVPSMAAAQDMELEEVVVTGSRIARDSNLSSNLPVQSVTAEDIQLSGEGSLAEVVNDVPALLNSLTAEQSQDNTGNRLGTNVLNLRGLGTARTLTLVDGRRHVGGLQGASAVDIGSIPQALVERVEVLTGGASAVYGADAVTGVVNFIMKDDFEGFEIDASGGLAQEGDSQRYGISAIWGSNFADDRGNIAVSAEYRDDRGLQVADRAGSEFIGSARDWVNPALRFQQGDITQGSTPNFDRYFRFSTTGLTDFGLPIPTADGFVEDYTSTFGEAPSLTDAEMSLINRAATAPQRAVLPGRTFPFTSGYGYIIPGNPFTFAGFDPEVDIDLDGNGRPDCLDSFTGYNSVFGAASFGVVGGCWNVDQNGNYAPVTDGLVAGSFQGFGGDSFNTLVNERSDIIPPTEKISLNLLGHFDLSDNARLFGEAKYVLQESSTDTRPNSFWDLLYGAADNPYLPEFIQPVADEVGGVAITVDPIHFNDIVTTERTTMRFVGGLEGEMANGWGYELSINYGVYDEETTSSADLINDRLFAAIDVVNDASGNPACRADVDPSAPAQNTPFEIPAYEAGYFSYTPGSGDCVPLNIWAGQPGVTDEAAAWVTTPTWDKLEIDQLVLSAVLTGNSSDLFELPGGPISFVAGAEYREETSEATFDDFQLGIIPPGSPFPAGTLLSDVSENSNLVFRPQLSVSNEIGEYDVTDVFFEVSAPLLADMPGVYELTVDAAVRFSDYSTIGEASTWKANVVYSPVRDLLVRASASKAVRAPNITELFGPQTGTTFRPADPCDAAQISAIREDDPGLADSTQQNCVSFFQGIGLDPFDASGNYVFADPLSASFGGLIGGNPNLTEETADTYTLGFVLSPTEFLAGLDLSFDYYEITIDDAISAVTGQDIVDGCFQAASLNPAFCQLLSRNDNPASAQFGGFDFLQSTDINFAKLETEGYDIIGSYTFDYGEFNWTFRAQATKVEKLDFFTNAADLSEVNPELGEVNRPEWAGNLGAILRFGGWRLALNSQYLGKQLVSFVEIETAQTLYGDAVFMDETWIHDISARYDYDESLSFYGGVNNVLDESPFATDRAWPASARGTYVFFGLNYQM